VIDRLIFFKQTGSIDFMEITTESSKKQKNIHAGIVEDDAAYSEFLVKELKSIPEIEKVTAFHSAEEYLRDDSAGFINLVFVDLRLPSMRGEELVALIRERNPETIICVVSSILEEEKVFTCLKNGAVGYASKQDVDALSEIVLTLISGGGILTPTVALLIAEHLQARPALNSELTTRERQILELLTSGKQAREVARFLGIAENTIRTHVKNIYRKLQVKNLSQLHALTREKNRL